jgi:hypothetical protein
MSIRMRVHFLKRKNPALGSGGMCKKGFKPEDTTASGSQNAFKMIAGRWVWRNEPIADSRHFKAAALRILE